MPSTRTERVRSHDGLELDALLTLPDSGRGPGIVLVQEIFGVNEYIRSVGERLAALGYASLAPDMFWRQQPGVALGVGEEALAEGVRLSQGFDAEAGLRDLEAALAHLRALPEVEGGAGVLGFCFGGTMAFRFAAAGDPDVAVSYYGSGVPAAVGELDRVTCPLLFHFGGSDPYLPREQVALVEQAAAGRPNVELHVHERAGHAFDNHTNPMFSDPDAAAAAWDQTVAFLRRHLPVPAPAAGS